MIKKRHAGHGRVGQTDSRFCFYNFQHYAQFYDLLFVMFCVLSVAEMCVK